jgi:GTP-binding protein HflX
MSVRESVGVDKLLEACIEMLSNRMRRACFLVPYDRSDLVAAMHNEGKVITIEYEENGTRIEAVLPVAFYNKIESYLVVQQ